MPGGRPDARSGARHPRPRGGAGWPCALSRGGHRRGHPPHEGPEGHRGDGALCRRASATPGALPPGRPASDGEHRAMTTERAPVVSAETPDQQLHHDLLAQAPGAVEALVHRYGVKIYRLALRITGSHEDAQEVSQDVLWTIVRKIGTFKGESALGSWIYRITANAAYEKLRSRRGKDEVSWEALLPAFDRDGHL